MNVRSILIILVVLTGVLYTYYKKPHHQKSARPISIKYEELGKVNIPLLLEFLNSRPKNDRTLIRNDEYFKAIMTCRKYRIKESVPWLIENIDLHTEDYYNAYNNQESHGIRHYFPCFEVLVSFNSLNDIDINIELLMKKAADLNQYGGDMCLIFLRNHKESLKINDSQKKRIDEISTQRKREFVVDMNFPDVKKTLDGPMYMGGTNMEIEQLRKRAEDRKREAELKTN
jgi:hypothetical protein